MIKKIITQNLPTSGMNGQYSWDETLDGISVDGQQQLYSLVDSNPTNVDYINDYRFVDSATFHIKQANIIINNNWSSYNHDFRVYMIDEAYNPNISQFIQ